MAMRRIPTLLEVERTHILNTLHVCGDNQTLAAKMLGLSVRSLRTKLHQYQKAGFEIPAPRARNEVSVEINVDRRIHGHERSAHETAAINVIEELISVVEAITERAEPGHADGDQMTRRKEKT